MSAVRVTLDVPWTQVGEDAGQGTKDGDTRTYWDCDDWTVQENGSLEVVGKRPVGDGGRMRALAVFGSGYWRHVELVEDDPSRAEEQAHQLTVAHSAAQTLVTCHETGEIDVSRFPGLEALLEAFGEPLPPSPQQVQRKELTRG